MIYFFAGAGRILVLNIANQYAAGEINNFSQAYQKQLLALFQIKNIWCHHKTVIAIVLITFFSIFFLSAIKLYQCW